MRLCSVLVVTALVAGGACSTGPGESPTADDPVAPEPGVVGGGSNDVRLTSILSISSPIALAMRSGDDTAFYLAQQSGRVVRVRNGDVTGTVLNISDLVSCCGERGLLGITFSPNGRRLYVNYTDNGGHQRRVVPDGRPSRGPRLTHLAARGQPTVREPQRR